MHEPKATLHRYLRTAREAFRWKLDGLSEYDLRRPLTPTATNLLGLLRHTSSVEVGYLGEVFGRPFPDAVPWFDECADVNADMWVPAGETSASVFAFADRAAAHADATIAALDLDAEGRVPWWGDAANPVTLHLILVHVVAEWNRHAGHADIVRELIDGEVGLRKGAENLPAVEPSWWIDYRARVERAALDAGGLTDRGPGPPA